MPMSSFFSYFLGSDCFEFHRSCFSSGETTNCGPIFLWSSYISFYLDTHGLDVHACYIQPSAQELFSIVPQLDWLNLVNSRLPWPWSKQGTYTRLNWYHLISTVTTCYLYFKITVIKKCITFYFRTLHVVQSRFQEFGLISLWNIMQHSASSGST